MARWVVISLERFHVPATWRPSLSTRQSMSGVMKPLLTPVGVQMKRSGEMRAEMLPPLPSQYSRIQMRRPISQISFLIFSAAGELNRVASSLVVTAVIASGVVWPCWEAKMILMLASEKASRAPGVSRTSRSWRNSLEPVLTNSAASF